MPKYQCEVCKKSFNQKNDLTRHKAKKNACISMEIIKEISRQNEIHKKEATEKQKELQPLCNNLGIILTDEEINTIETDLVNNFVYKQLKTNPKYPNYNKYINNLKTIISHVNDFIKNINKFINENNKVICDRLQNGLNFYKVLNPFNFTNNNELSFATSFLKVLLNRNKIETTLDNRLVLIFLWLQTNNDNNEYKISISCTINNYSKDNTKNYIEYAIENNIKLPEIDMINNKKNELNNSLLSVDKIKQILSEKKGEYEKKLLDENNIIFYTHEMQLSNNNICNGVILKYIDSIFYEYKERIKEKISSEKIDMIYEAFGKLIIDPECHGNTSNINIYYCIKQIN